MHVVHFCPLNLTCVLPCGKVMLWKKEKQVTVENAFRHSEKMITTLFSKSTQNHDARQRNSKKLLMVNIMH